MTAAAGRRIRTLDNRRMPARRGWTGLRPAPQERGIAGGAPAGHQDGGRPTAAPDSVRPAPGRPGRGARPGTERFGGGRAVAGAGTAGEDRTVTTVLAPDAPRTRGRPGCPEPGSGILHLVQGKGPMPGPTAGGGSGCGPTG